MISDGRTDPLPADRALQRRKSVRDVRIVAVIFLAEGLIAVFEMVQTRRLAFGPGLLELATGIGLLRYRNGWRIFAVVILWLTIVLAVFAGAIAIFRGEHLWAVVVAPVQSNAVAVMLLIVILGLMLWQVRVLTRPEVRRAFELGDPAA